MLLIPNAIFTEYVTHLNKREIAVGHFAEYKKWLRYYLDFCDKYPVPDAKSERVRLFREFWGHNTVHSRPLLGRPGLPLLRSRPVRFSITVVNPSLPAGNPVLVASRSSFDMSMSNCIMSPELRRWLKTSLFHFVFLPL